VRCDLSPLDDPDRFVAALAACEDMGWAESLELGYEAGGANFCLAHDSPVGSGSFRALAESPRLRRLRRLRITGLPLSPTRLVSLLESRELAGVRDLSAGGHLESWCPYSAPRVSPTIDSTAVRALAASPAAARLKVLSLTNQRLSEDDVWALLASPHLAGLQQLSVDTTDYRGAPNFSRRLRRALRRFSGPGEASV
jgi:hypothetical protein